MKNKKWIFISLGAVALIGGIIWYKRSQKKSDSEETDLGEEAGGEQELKMPDEFSTNPVVSSSSGGATSFPQTPFKNDAEGNSFRAWVNKKYPDKAKEYNLDPKGSYDNQYIRRAYSFLGSEYNKTQFDAALAAKLEIEKKKYEDKYLSQTKPVTVVTPKGAFVNVRSSAVINDSLLGNNTITKLKKGNTLTVLKTVKGSDLLNWYKVKLKTEVFGQSLSRDAYVRSDTVSKKTIRVSKI
jgi:hypothetical protein